MDRPPGSCEPCPARRARRAWQRNAWATVAILWAGWGEVFLITDIFAVRYRGLVRHLVWADGLKWILIGSVGFIAVVRVETAATKRWTSGRPLRWVSLAAAFLFFCGVALTIVLLLRGRK